jgi:hypothetical protein
MQLKPLIPIIPLIAALATPALAEKPDHLKKLLETKQCSMCDLSDANLSGMDLRRANLRGALLLNANLSKANLQNADLTSAILDGADLSGTDLSQANLAGASLYRIRADRWGGFIVTGTQFQNTVMPDGQVREPIAGSTTPTNQTGSDRANKPAPGGNSQPGSTQLTDSIRQSILYQQYKQAFPTSPVNPPQVPNPSGNTPKSAEPSQVPNPPSGNIQKP